MSEEQMAELDRRIVESDKPKRGHCKHGVARGWRCWQCRGKAIIEGDKEPEEPKQRKTSKPIRRGRAKS